MSNIYHYLDLSDQNQEALQTLLDDSLLQELKSKSIKEFVLMLMVGKADRGKQNKIKN